MARIIDITGKKFGKLTAVNHVSGVYWRCKCDCGNWKVTRSDSLRSGQVYSCGCERKKQKKLKCGEDCFNCPYPDCIY